MSPAWRCHQNVPFRFPPKRRKVPGVETEDGDHPRHSGENQINDFVHKKEISIRKNLFYFFQTLQKI